jgi:hypothetical protein
MTEHRVPPSIQREKGLAMAKSNQPAAKFRVGLVTATVWKNDSFFNTSITKAYKDGDQWKDGDSFSHGDLLNVAKAAERAEAWIADQQQ